MSDPIKRAASEGKFEEVGGAIKKKIGHLIGDDQMEAEGEAKELAGKARKDAANATEQARGAVKEVVGKVENRVGHLIDNSKMQNEGRRLEKEGQTQRKAGK